MTNSVAESMTLSRRELWRRNLLYPAHTFPIAAPPVIMALSLAAHNGVRAVVPALLAFLVGWLIQIGGVITDNYVNLVEQPEDREHPELVAAVKAGSLTIVGLKRAIYVCYTLALAAGAYLLSIGGLPVLVIGLASIAASLIYSAGPYPLGRHGLADPLFFMFFGVVSVVASYFVQAAATRGASWDSLAPLFALPPTVFVCSLPIGALTTNILIIDDIRDVEFDVAKGKRTVAVRFGTEWSRAEFVLLLVLAYVVPLWLYLTHVFSAWVLLPLLTIPYAASSARAIFILERFEDLVPMTPKGARLLLAYAVLLAIGVAA
jgi:1,4-dihydroxy-2-naphthoate polyprenyltransferase